MSERKISEKTDTLLGDCLLDSDLRDEVFSILSSDVGFVMELFEQIANCSYSESLSSMSVSDVMSNATYAKDLVRAAKDALRPVALDMIERDEYPSFRQESQEMIKEAIDNIVISHEKIIPDNIVVFKSKDT